MTRAKERQPAHIPDFKSREEMAEFWDTHDASDYWDELKPVEVRVAKELSEPLSVRLDKGTVAKLRQKAHAKGIGPTTLIRMWVLERLEAEEHQSKHG